MRIRTVTLENFRGFRGTTEIDLSADVVAIYARNGVGKTTIFDAIELCLLGEIARFADVDVTPGVFLPNVLEAPTARIGVEFADADKAFVELLLSEEGEYSLRTNSGCNTHRDLLYDWFILEDYEPPRREVGAIRELFRSSLFLSQSNIRDFLNGDPEGRFAVLANLTGAASLQRYIEKLEAVEKETTRRFHEVQSELEGLEGNKILPRKQLSVMEERQRNLGARLGQDVVDREILKREIGAIELSLGAQALDELEPQTFAALVLAACDDSGRRIDLRIGELASLEALAPGHRQRLEQREKQSARLRELQTRLANLDAQESVAISSSESNKREINAIEENILESGLRLTALGALPRLKAAISEKKEILNLLISDRAKLNESLRSLRDRLPEMRGRLTSLNDDKLRLERSNIESSGRLAALERLRTAIPAYEADVATVARCDQERMALTTDRQALQRALDALIDERRNEQRLVQAAEADQSLIRSSIESKNALIAQLRDYATDRQCPLCGHPHSSKDALAQSIDQQLAGASPVILRAAERVAAEKRAVREVDNNIERTQQEIGRYDEELKTLSKAREDAVGRLREREQEAGRLDCRIEISAVDSAIAAVRGEIERVELRLVDFSAQVAELSNEIDDLKIRESQGDSSLAERERHVQTLLSDIQAYQVQVVELGLSEAVDWTGAKLEVERDQLRNLFEGLQETRARYQRTVIESQRTLDLIRGERAEVENAISDCEERLSRLNEDAERVRTICTRLGLSESTIEESVQIERARLGAQLATLSDLEQIAQKYSLSSEIESLTAQADTLRRDLEEIEREHQRVKSMQGRLLDVGDQVKRWLEVLRIDVTNIVEEKIDLHHPEIVQQFKAMVPNPYLFEDILMERSGSRLSLGLKYRGQLRETAEPRLFLSSAQANVLALAVFLSFSCRQKWSRLEAILLDDPVQQLDDLDAVAFLDSLRSAALGRHGARKQIIVSTCDQNLYLLMIRKFRLIQADGLRFRGISLLDRGTNAPDVVYDIGGPDSAAPLAYGGPAKLAS
jgi:DNA repair exonuclease SbcCD ATPase subunit